MLMRVMVISETRVDGIDGSSPITQIPRDQQTQKGAQGAIQLL